METILEQVKCMRNNIEELNEKLFSFEGSNYFHVQDPRYKRWIDEKQLLNNNIQELLLKLCNKVNPDTETIKPYEGNGAIRSSFDRNDRIMGNEHNFNPDYSKLMSNLKTENYTSKSVPDLLVDTSGGPSTHQIFQDLMYGGHNPTPNQDINNTHNYLPNDPWYSSQFVTPNPQMSNGDPRIRNKSGQNFLPSNEMVDNINSISLNNQSASNVSYVIDRIPGRSFIDDKSDDDQLSVSVGEKRKSDFQAEVKEELELYTKQKLYIAEVMRNFNDNKISFKTLDGKVIWKKDYPDVVTPQVKLGKELEDIIQGTVRVYKTGYIKKSEQYIETKLFTPYFERPKVIK